MLSEAPAKQDGRSSDYARSSSQAPERSVNHSTAAGHLRRDAGPVITTRFRSNSEELDMPNIDIPDASNLTGMMEWEGKNKKPNAEQVEIDFKRFEGDIYVVLIGETREVTLRVSPEQLCACRRSCSIWRRLPRMIPTTRSCCRERAAERYFRNRFRKAETWSPSTGLHRKPRAGLRSVSRRHHQAR